MASKRDSSGSVVNAVHRPYNMSSSSNGGPNQSANPNARSSRFDTNAAVKVKSEAESNRSVSGSGSNENATGDNSSRFQLKSSETAQPVVGDKRKKFTG